jgi:hypothetical protein
MKNFDPVFVHSSAPRTYVKTMTEAEALQEYKERKNRKYKGVEKGENVRILYSN